MAESETKRELTAKQQKFIAEYLGNGFNATRAAIAAGYSKDSASEIGSQNLRKVEIAEAIQAEFTAQGIIPGKLRVLLAEIATGADMRLFEEYVRNGTSLEDMHKEGVNTALVKSLTETVTQHGGSRRIELHDRLSAISKLVDILGMVTKKHEIDAKVRANAAGMTLEEAMAESQALGISVEEFSGGGGDDSNGA